MGKSEGVFFGSTRNRVRSARHSFQSRYIYDRRIGLKERKGSMAIRRWSWSWSLLVFTWDFRLLYCCKYPEYGSLLTTLCHEISVQPISLSSQSICLEFCTWLHWPQPCVTWRRAMKSRWWSNPEVRSSRRDLERLNSPRYLWGKSYDVRGRAFHVKVEHIVNVSIKMGHSQMIPSQARNFGAPHSSAYFWLFSNPLTTLAVLQASELLVN